MKIAILTLSLWAITADAGPVIKSAVAPPTTPTAPPTPTPTQTAPALPADLVASKYKASFKLANVKYADELTSYDSGVYQNYAGKILKALMDLYADDNAYRDAQMIGFRNESGVVADVSLRFANESKNLVSLDALIKTGVLGELPVDPASFNATVDESFPAMVGGMGCPPPCGAPTTCYPQCNQDCCGSSAPSAPYTPQMNQPFGAPMPMGGESQCPGSCPSSCAPSCEQSCCGSTGGPSPMMG